MKVKVGNVRDFFRGITLKAANSRIPRIPVNTVEILIYGARTILREREEGDSEDAIVSDTYQFLCKNEDGKEFAASFGTLPKNVLSAFLALDESDRASFFNGEMPFALTGMKCVDTYILDAGKRKLNSQGEEIIFTTVVEANIVPALIYQKSNPDSKMSAIAADIF